MNTIVLEIPDFEDKYPTEEEADNIHQNILTICDSSAYKCLESFRLLLTCCNKDSVVEFNREFRCPRTLAVFNKVFRTLLDDGVVHASDNNNEKEKEDQEEPKVLIQMLQNNLSSEIEGSSKFIMQSGNNNNSNSEVWHYRKFAHFCNEMCTPISFLFPMPSTSALKDNDCRRIAFSEYSLASHIMLHRFFLGFEQDMKDSSL